MRVVADGMHAARRGKRDRLSRMRIVTRSRNEHGAGAMGGMGHARGGEVPGNARLSARALASRMRDWDESSSPKVIPWHGGGPGCLS